MSASTDESPAGALAAAWRPAGVLYLALCLAGLAIGLWPGSIHPAVRQPDQPAPRPALQCLAVAQAAFILLVYPLVLAARVRRGRAVGPWWAGALEPLVMLAATAPMYVAAAYLSNAVAADAVRSAIYAALLFGLAFAASPWIAHGPARSAAMAAMALAALGLPAAYYVAVELLPEGQYGWLWRLGPATFAWELARSRAGPWYPRPAWAALVWPAVAVAAGLLRLTLPRAERRGKQDAKKAD